MPKAKTGALQNLSERPEFASISHRRIGPCRPYSLLAGNLARQRLGVRPSSGAFGGWAALSPQAFRSTTGRFLLSRQLIFAVESALLEFGGLLRTSGSLRQL